MVHRGFIRAVIVSGMVEEKSKQATEQKEAHKPWTLKEFGGKPVWDWLQLLIVPFVLSLITVAFAWQQNARQEKIEDRRAQVERKIQEQRAEHATLQAYLDQMGALLLDRDLHASDENSDVRKLARARTLVVLDALGSDNQERLLRFLHETDLIRPTPPDEQPVIPLKYAHLENIELPHRIILKGADLQQANLSGANLSETDLRGTYLAGAHLEGANLEGAELKGADLSGTFLSGADLSGADLTDVDLSNAEELWERGTHLWKRGAGLGDADLRGANLSGANLSGANLSGANLSGANLSGAHLSGAHLSGANLKGADVTDEQLAECASLKGATMPNGQKYEEWLKDKEGGEENVAPS